MAPAQMLNIVSRARRRSIRISLPKFPGLVCDTLPTNLRRWNRLGRVPVVGDMITPSQPPHLARIDEPQGLAGEGSKLFADEDGSLVRDRSEE